MLTYNAVFSGVTSGLEHTVYITNHFLNIVKSKKN